MHGQVDNKVTAIQTKISEIEFKLSMRVIVRQITKRNQVGIKGFFHKMFTFWTKKIFWVKKKIGIQY